MIGSIILIEQTTKALDLRHPTFSFSFSLPLSLSLYFLLCRNLVVEKRVEHLFKIGAHDHKTAYGPSKMMKR